MGTKTVEGVVALGHSNVHLLKLKGLDRRSLFPVESNTEYHFSELDPGIIPKSLESLELSSLREWGAAGKDDRKQEC